MINKYICAISILFSISLQAVDPTPLGAPSNPTHVTNHFHFTEKQPVTFIFNSQNTSQHVDLDPTTLISQSKKPTWASLSQYCKDHKLRLILAGTAGSYAIIMLKLIHAKYQLAKHSWAHWKSSMSLTDLLEQPQKKMMQELLTAIETKYNNSNNPGKALMPLIQFINDTTYEKQQVQSHITLTTWITRLKLTRVFPLSSSILSQAKQQEERLAYISSLFASWTTEHSMSSVQN